MNGLRLAACVATASLWASSAAAVVIDFEGCTVGTSCFPQPLEHVGITGAGQVVDLGGNKVFRLDDGAKPGVRGVLHPSGSNAHIPVDPAVYGTTEVYFTIDALSFDVFMPTGGFLFNAAHIGAPGKTVFPAATWVTYHQPGYAVPYFAAFGWSIAFRGGKVFIDNVSYERGLAEAPEPATWVLLIAGFGLAGAALRRKSRWVTA